MSTSDREGLIARIRHVRRIAAVREKPKGEAEEPQNERMRSLEARVGHLERLVEGLQDSVHRESDRHAKMIAELQAQVEPGAMSASLADDARHRGL
jgi:uncharacterized coiled-coil protein SlyX